LLAERTWCFIVDRNEISSDAASASVSGREAEMKAEWVNRPCPLCGWNGESPVFAESNIDLAELGGFAFASRKLPEYMHPRLLVCGRCGILYGNPVLSPGTLARAYRTADFDSGDEAHYASATYAAQVRKILPRFPDLKGALDIGTGDGAFLEALVHLGFQNVAGVEPSRAPVAAAKAHVRPLIRLDVFRPEDLPAASFSLVSCFQTMEHVGDPLGAVRGAYGLLKPGGAFLMAVHNRKSILAKVLGMKSPIFDVEHLQLFCPATGKLLLERAGFRDVAVSALWNRYPLHYWVKLLPMPDSIKRPLLAVLKQSIIGRVPLAFPPGNLICVGFK
jgi:SAM-dependent methyltransferase